jgi:hypothetical protein
MVRPRTSPEATPILQLLSDYSFDVDAYAEAMVTGWLQRFEPAWVSQAITEALYQGRYKMVSVDHILQIWQRRGQPLRHFNREFESIILGQSWGQFLAATKANATSPDADPQSSSAPTKESDAQHPTNAATDWGNGHPVTPSLAEAFLSAHGSAHASPDWFTPNLAGPGLSETESLPPDPPKDSPALFGGSSRTIPPLTPDQLARLTQPTVVPAANSAVEEPQNHPPIDDLDHLSTNTQPAEAGTPAEERNAATNADQMSEALLGLETATIAESIANPITLEETAPEETATEPPATESLDLESADSEQAPMLQPDSAPGGETNVAPIGIPNFQPVAALASHPESADSIPPFVPAPGPSELHQRLKAVVEAGRQDN